MKVDNRSPLPHHVWVWSDATGREFASIIVKGSFAFGEAVPADRPEDIIVADQLRASGTIAKPSDIAMRRTGTSVVIDASIVSPTGEEVVEASALVRVGSLTKGLVALGPRFWEKRHGKWAPTPPALFTSVPATLESAFGGPRSPENPFGRGHVESAEPDDATPLPLVEDPAARIAAPSDKPGPISLDAVPPVCSPRRERGGTYDDAWRRRRAPLPPDDFLQAFWDVSRDDLVARPSLVGGEEVQLSGLSRGGTIAFALPRNLVRIEVDGVVHIPHLDLLRIDVEERRLSLTLRHTVEVKGFGYRLPRVTIRLLARKEREIV
jgi:hypothetical protein